jgi:hypothetical protein
MSRSLLEKLTEYRSAISSKRQAIGVRYDSGNCFYRTLMPNSKVAIRHNPVKAVEGHYQKLYSQEC